MSGVIGEDKHIDRDEPQPRCPGCGHALEWLGTEDTARGGLTMGPLHAYVCPAGCRGPMPDGTFAFAACPVCGSHDTARGPHLDGWEELLCNVCGAVVTVQLQGSPD